MILVGVGSNLAAHGYASPRDTAAAAVAALPGHGIEVVARSAWYASEPVPRSAQPWYINAVIAVATSLTPEPLLDALLALESRFWRRRGLPNAPRTLDLDLLDFDGAVIESAHLTLPHPRLHQRRFVLEPLNEIAPDWRHPLLGATAAALASGLPPGQPVKRIRDRPR
jgi:2-amino-4-hydroxy-6-hydroxymethyldihydropteridine diphosphokinase